MEWSKELRIMFGICFILSIRIGTINFPDIRIVYGANIYNAYVWLFSI